MSGIIFFLNFERICFFFLKLCQIEKISINSMKSILRKFRWIPSVENFKLTFRKCVRILIHARKMLQVWIWKIVSWWDVMSYFGNRSHITLIKIWWKFGCCGICVWANRRNRNTSCRCSMAQNVINIEWKFGTWFGHIFFCFSKQHTQRFQQFLS